MVGIVALVVAIIFVAHKRRKLNKSANFEEMHTISYGPNVEYQKILERAGPSATWEVLIHKSKQRRKKIIVDNHFSLSLPLHSSIKTDSTFCTTPQQLAI